MEIKQGDKVRVSSRLPRIYERFGSMIAPYYECKVVEINDGMALLDSIPAKHIFLFPLKYLVKVDAEAKEPKFKVGDKVRVSGGVLDGGVFTIMDRRFDGGGWIYELSIRACIGESRLEPYTEPTEQPKASADVLGEFTPISMSTNPIIGFEQAYWQEYEADLAKEVALKVANKFNDPEQAAEYAVSVAKAVVEGLKRK